MASNGANAVTGGQSNYYQMSSFNKRHRYTFQSRCFLFSLHNVSSQPEPSAFILLSVLIAYTLMYHLKVVYDTTMYGKIKR